MTEQNRRYVTKEIGKLLSEIWRIKGLAEQEYGPQHRSPRSSPACMQKHRHCYRRRPGSYELQSTRFRQRKNRQRGKCDNAAVHEHSQDSKNEDNS